LETESLVAKVIQHHLAVTASFYFMISLSFTVILLCDVTWSELLKASLNKPWTK